ncbi:MAG TPA: tetratricopeptide repeat protein [Pyrinomonadaceae bacterium]|nr:tetratricopeptide repeat protein [Pyrinomonadaceae bacterium]
MQTAPATLAARPRAILLALICVVLAHVGAAGQAQGRAAELEQAAALIAGGRLAEAEGRLNKILKVTPDEAAALNLLGAIRAKQGRLGEAESFFARAVRGDGRLTGARMNLAYLYLLRGEREKGAAELREVLRREPANAEAGYRLAWLLLSQGRYDECVALAESLKRSQTLSPALLAVVGDAHLKKGDADKAEESYLEALAAQATNAEALLGLARVWQARGDAERAAAHLGRAKDAVANSPDLLQRFAGVALDLGQKKEGITALQRAVELRPGEPSYHFALGAAWLSHPPDLLGAEEAFGQFLKLRPDDARAQLLLGYVLLRQKKHAEARAWLERLVASGAGTSEAFYYLGLIAQGQNEDARAVELFERAIRLAPTFAPAHVALGATLLKLKDYARARQALETGVKLNPEDTKAHYNLAMLYARLKDTERAREATRVLERLRGEGKTPEDETEAPAPPPR